MYEGSNQMSEHKNNKLFHMPGKPSKKAIIAIVCVLALAAIAFILVSSGIAGRILGSGNVSFTPLDAKDIPRAIEKVNLEKTGDASNLVVTAKFTDPPQGKTVSRVITYPYEVASTDLKGLPDTIELNVRYA